MAKAKKMDRRLEPTTLRSKTAVQGSNASEEAQYGQGRNEKMEKWGRRGDRGVEGGKREKV